MLEKYKTVYTGGEGEIVEKKSRFIATVRPVETEEEALAFIEEMKKKYWDARHNCYVYSVGKNREYTRCSDDGEPSGTAGRPMLDVILGEDIYRIIDKEYCRLLVEKEEKILSSLSQVMGNSEEVFDALTNSDMSFGFIKDEDGEEVELTNSSYSKLIKSNDRRVRYDTFKRLYEVYSSYKNTMAKIISGDVKANVACSELKHYPSALEASLFADNIDKKVYDNLIDTVHNNLEPLYYYFELKRKMLGLDELHLYDNMYKTK